MANTHARNTKPGRKPRPDTTVSADEYTGATVPPMPAPDDYGLSTWNADTAEFEPVAEWPPICRRVWEGIWTSPVRGTLVEADTHAAEMVIWHLAHAVDPQAKPADKIKHSAAYEKGLSALGLTPDGRAKLKITVAQAGDAEDRRARRALAQPAGQPADGPRAEVIDLYQRHSGTGTP